MLRHLIPVALLLWSTPTLAHDWYDSDCCDIDDCRPISGVDAQGRPWSEIEQTADGYVWTSSKTGQVYRFRETETMVSGKPRIRPSRDGRYHGCENPRPPAALCLYVPQMF